MARKRVVKKIVKRVKDEFIQVNEAAIIMNVCPQTIRSWADGDRIKAKRHPLNNYRLISKASVLKLKSQIGTF